MTNVTVKAQPDGRHDISLGKVVVNTIGLHARDVLNALCGLSRTAKASDVAYFVWRVLDCMDGFPDAEPDPPKPKPKRCKPRNGRRKAKAQ